MWLSEICLSVQVATLYHHSEKKNYQDSVGVVNVVAVSVLIEKIKHGWFDATIHREFVEQRNIR